MENLQILKTVENGKIDKEKSKGLTGYPSIDKPWLKYYDKGADTRKVPEKTLYEALLDTIKENPSGIAFICADRDEEKITFEQFGKLVDNMAKSLIACGVKEGDEIIATFKNSVEGIALVFAKSRLGVKTHFIDPSNSPAEKIRMISETNASYYFVEEEFLGMLKPVFQETKLEKAVILPPLYANKTVSDLTNLNPKGKYLSYQDFMDLGKNIELPKEIHKFSKNEVSSIMYTGGSTGKSKGVMLTDYNFVAKYYRQMFSNWKWGKDRINLCALPGIIAFGLSEAIISPLLAGETSVIVDCLKIPSFPEFVLKYKPNDAACSPIHIEFLINSPLITDETDLSHLEMLPCGGDGMKKDVDEMARKFFEKHGAKDAFAQGCGFTESTGAFCYGLGEANEPGYMGIPLAGNVSAVFDPDTLEELKYNEIGEWGVLTDTTMMGYLGDLKEKEAKTLKVHKDGKVWLHPGDMVHMNEDGKIAMHDRTSRTFNYMGMKIYPSALETCLSKHPAIKKCILTGVKASYGQEVKVTDQKVPIVNLVVEDEYKGLEQQVMSELDDILKEQAQTYVNIFAYIFRDALPYTNRGKINYQQLEADGVTEEADRKVFVKTMSK